jgi:hypothetical protein
MPVFDEYLLGVFAGSSGEISLEIRVFCAAGISQNCLIGAADQVDKGVI